LSCILDRWLLDSFWPICRIYHCKTLRQHCSRGNSSAQVPLLQLRVAEEIFAVFVSVCRFCLYISDNRPKPWLYFVFQPEGFTFLRSSVCHPGFCTCPTSVSPSSISLIYDVVYPPKLVSLHSSCGLFSVPCWGSFVATVLPSNLLLLLANLLGSNKSRSSSNSTINQNGNNNHFIAIKPFILIEFNCVYTSLKPFGSCYCGSAKITKLFCLALRVFYTIKNLGLLKLSY